MTTQAADITDSQEIADFWHALMGTTEIHSQIYHDYSPIAHVSENEPPFLIVHGGGDTVVLPGESQNLHHTLLKTGNHSELMVVDGADHLFEVNGVSQDEVIKAKILPFLVKHLK
jgi:dipeptidyl aminopeptidase/acylaminoacyl peptidase